MLPKSTRASFDHEGSRGQRGWGSLPAFDDEQVVLPRNQSGQERELGHQEEGSKPRRSSHAGRIVTAVPCDVRVRILTPSRPVECNTSGSDSHVYRIPGLRRKGWIDKSSADNSGSLRSNDGHAVLAGHEESQPNEIRSYCTQLVTSKAINKKRNRYATEQLVPHSSKVDPCASRGKGSRKIRPVADQTVAVRFDVEQHRQYPHHTCAWLHADAGHAQIYGRRRASTEQLTWT